jgi:hypothetical protein
MSVTDFQTRNEQWSGHPRDFRQFHSRTGTPRTWFITVDGDTVVTSWGLLEGQLQTAYETFQGVNIGKKNEKSPAQYALERAREYCRKKHWEGYREFDAAGQALDPLVETNIDFDNLPLSLCFYKPLNTAGAGLLKRAEKGEIWYSRKCNGLAFILARGESSAKLYSRKMLRQHDDESGTPYTWDDRFPHIIEAANRIMPPNSILLGELVAFDKHGVENVKHTKSITKSLTAQSLKDQQEKGLPTFYIWDVAFWDGVDLVTTAPVRARYEIIHSIEFRYTCVGPGLNCLMPVEYFTSEHFPTPDAALTHAKKLKWEGFVLVDPDGIYGDKAYNFRGKPDRPGHACAKLKPDYESDFVVYWDPERGIGERSTKGRYAQGIKSVALYQYNTRGELVYICNCASGMTEAMKRDWADPKFYPQVWEVIYTDRRYQSRGDDTNALDFPRFSQVRTDKSPDECIDEDL